MDKQYIINYEWPVSEGVSVQFYRLIGYKNLGFKEFSGRKGKKKANFACAKQKQLSKLGLAPKVIGNVCKVKCVDKDMLFLSDWGYITQIAQTKEKYSMKEIQSLVDNIKEKAGLKFWDCHDYNIGILKVRGKNKLVCIDTGEESFDRECNAWGFREPGPKCVDCKKYNCDCCDYYCEED